MVGAGAMVFSDEDVDYLIDLMLNGECGDDVMVRGFEILERLLLRGIFWFVVDGRE